MDTDVTAVVEDPTSAALCLLVSVNGVLATHPLGPGTLVIGRHSGCDVVVEHPSVSRRHAELTTAPLAIRDLGSSNGTRLRGRRLVPRAATPVEIGDALQLGEAVVLVQRVSHAEGGARSWRGRPLDARLVEECARSARSGQPFGFARIHVDGDADVVDEVLAASLRTTDVFARAAPGHWHVLLVDTPAASARAGMERAIARLRAAGMAPAWSLACWPRDGATAEQLSAHAWTALRAGPGVMDRVRALIEQVADSSLSVLIRGETGVGKELCAEMLHRLSGRARRPFVKINCAALSEQLLESELFGHERGAFTGAVAAKPGLLETADGGTLFLDEVGDLPRALQAKLLRVLEDRVVQRVGAIEGRTVDVRFVAATNRPLEADIAAGRFRRDLYFRLGGVTVEVPPLRERAAEIEGLALAFVARAAEAANRPAPAVTDAAHAALRAHTWPGNVRELRNTIDRAVLLCGEGPIDIGHLAMFDADAARTATHDVPTGADDDDAPTMPLDAGRPDRPTHPPFEGRPAGPGAPAVASLRGEVARLEAQRIADALGACGGNQTRAARMLGISRNTLQARMDVYGIPRPRKK